MKHFKAMAVVVLAGALMASLTACAGKQPGSTGDGASGTTAWILSGEPKESMFTDSFGKWSTAHPDQTISVQKYADSAYKEKIRTAIGAGQAPTMVFNWGAFGAVSEYMEAKQIISLDGKVDKAMSRAFPSVVQAGKLNGQTVAVPNSDSQPVVVYYNKELFDKAGVKAPIETWDELLSSIDKFKAIGVAPIALAGVAKWTNMMYLEYLADRVGGPQTFNDVVAGKAGAWSSPEMLKALGMIKDLVDADAFQDSFATTGNDNKADAALVYSNKAAMLVQGAWEWGMFKADAPDFVASGKLGTFAFPAVPGGKGDPRNLAGNPSNYWSISSSATPEAQQAAIDYLNAENLSDDVVDKMIAGGNIPPVAGVEDKLKKADDADFLTSAYAMIQEAPNFQASWDQVLSSAAAQELLTNLDMIFQGQITPQQFADNMNKTL